MVVYPQKSLMPLQLLLLLKLPQLLPQRQQLPAVALPQPAKRCYGCHCRCRYTAPLLMRLQQQLRLQL